MLNIGELKVVEVKNFTQFPWLNADWEPFHCLHPERGKNQTLTGFSL